MGHKNMRVASAKITPTPPYRTRPTAGRLSPKQFIRVRILGPVPNNLTQGVLESGTHDEKVRRRRQYSSNIQLVLWI